MHTDIDTKNWIEDLPPAVQPFIYLARLDRPIGVWLLLLPGWWAITLAAGGFQAMNSHDWGAMFYFLIGAIVMRAAGCVINDLWDRKLDRAVERTAQRPLAAGTVSVRAALIFLAGLLALGLVILLQLSLVAILLGILVMPMIVLYPFMKRITWWPQAFLGLTFNFGALMGWATVSGLVGLPALLLYIGGIFWTLGYDTIYAHQDKEDDMRIGIKSTALRLAEHSRRAIIVFYALTWGLILLAFILAGAGWLSLLVVAGSGVLLVRQITHWDPDDQNSSLSTFKSARDFGLVILVAAGV